MEGKEETRGREGENGGEQKGEKEEGREDRREGREQWKSIGLRTS